MVLTTPVVRNLKNQMYEGVEIHYLTKNKFRSIVDSNPHISKVYGIDKSTNEVIEELKAEQYHYIIDLQRNLRSARVKRALKELSFTFEKYNWEKWLLVNFGINKMPKVHIVDRYMATITRFDIQNDNEGLDFFIPEGKELTADRVPESHQNGFIALGIGAAHWRKKPRKEQYITLCKQLHYPIALVGGPAEKELGEEIAFTSETHVWNTAGMLSLNESASLVKQCKLIITPDTGIMHIAAAFKKPIISLWGATVPDFGMYPYQNDALNEMIQADHLNKRPCSKLGTKCKYKECRCIDELPLEKVVVVAEREMEDKSP
ncbi:glycosyltransferase family 9 protein [Cryomorpha ignava]|uniref:Glycosyltransferase family 9 protein n=2 Tax=Cryomorpha ignava TaxID=101383 RepID=A0A7K3WQR1_9FLAO|nr:glycosyltransferase family 9 protein [Cryomorpha ignava]